MGRGIEDVWYEIGGINIYRVIEVRKGEGEGERGRKVGGRRRTKREGGGERWKGTEKGEIEFVY